MNKTKWFLPEVRERALRLVFDHQAEHSSQWAATRVRLQIAASDPADSARNRVANVNQGSHKQLVRHLELGCWMSKLSNPPTLGCPS